LILYAVVADVHTPQYWTFDLIGPLRRRPLCPRVAIGVEKPYTTGAFRYPPHNAKAMPTINFLTQHDRVPWFRQTPEGDGIWGTSRFTINGDARGFDWLVAYDEINGQVRCDIPESRRLLIISEPPGMKNYHPRYLNQFGTLISPVAMPGFAGRVVREQPGLPWFLGLDLSNAASSVPSRYSYKELAALPYPQKQHGLSAVISTKSKLPKHRRRVEFVLELRERLGEKFHLFGRGFREIDDKAEAILPYSHHLVIENNDEDSFFTEKLADAFLGWSLPLFSGCRNIDRYFDDGMLLPIDIERTDAIDIIAAMLAEPIIPQRLDLIGAARVRLMTRYNVFALIHGIVEAEAEHNGPGAETVLLKPNFHYGSLPKRLRLGWRAMMSALRH
jgi:hypothetical protein